MHSADELIRQGLGELQRLGRPAASPPFAPLYHYFSHRFPEWEALSLTNGARLFVSVARGYRPSDLTYALYAGQVIVEPLWQAWQDIARQLNPKQQGASVAYAFLILHARRWRRLLRQYLRRRFQFVSARNSFVCTAQVLQDSKEALDFVTVLFWHAVYDEMFTKGFYTLIAAIATGKPQNQQAAEAALAMWEVPLHVAERFKDVPHTGWREAMVVALSGWYPTQINLPLNIRLGKALKNGDGVSPRDTLRHRLPGAVVMAINQDVNADPHKDLLTTLQARITHILEAEAPPPASRNTRRRVTESQPPFEELLVKEEAYRQLDIDQLKGRARLSPRECELLALMLELTAQADGFTYEQVAACMGIKDGTVKAMTDRLRKKLKESFGA